MIAGVMQEYGISSNAVYNAAFEQVLNRSKHHILDWDTFITQICLAAFDRLVRVAKLDAGILGEQSGMAAGDIGNIIEMELGEKVKYGETEEDEPWLYEVGKYGMRPVIFNNSYSKRKEGSR